MTEQHTKPTIVLAMMVKDEERVIARCLESVRPYITHWVITDTGSTDNTMEVIKKTMEGIPGALVQSPWVSWPVNRSEVLALARGLADYTLCFVDADEVLEVSDPTALDRLTHDAYHVQHHMGDMEWSRLSLFKNTLPWRCDFEYHEHPTPDCPHTSDTLRGIVLVNYADGDATTDPLRQIMRYTEEAQHFERMLEKSPGDTRAQFYLAQSYRDSLQTNKAVEAYSRRATMRGFDEEIFESLLNIGHLMQDVLGSPEAEVADAYLRAYQVRPKRAEAMYYLGRYYREKAQKYALAEVYLRHAVATPKPNDLLFLNSSVYAWRAKDELATTLTWTGKEAEALLLIEELQAMGISSQVARYAQMKELCLSHLGRSSQMNALTPEQKAQIRLNLGCGNKPRFGYVNVDVNDPADVVADLSLPWPWQDSSVDEILAENVFQYLPDIILTMNEAHRVMKSGGRLVLTAPIASHPSAEGDVAAKSRWVEDTLGHFIRGSTEHERWKRVRGIIATFDTELVEIDGGGIIRATLRSVK